MSYIWKLSSRSYIKPLIYMFRKRINSIRYSNPPDPNEMLYIDTDIIKYHSLSHFTPEIKYKGKIVDGDWDKKKERYRDCPQYFGIKQRFSMKKDWKETAYYNYLTEKIEREGQFLGCHDHQDVVKRCAYIDSLYQSMNENGYQLDPNKRIDDQNYHPNSGPAPCLVNIGRTGEIILQDGRHRVAIADLLEIQVPIQVIVRHKDWQLLRENSQLKKGNEQLDHPDLPC